MANSVYHHSNNRPIANGTADPNNDVRMPSKEDGSLSSATVLNTFRSIKEVTDDFVVKNKMETYCDEFTPRSDELAIAIFCNAFEELGCPIRSTAPGTKLERIKDLPRHEKVIDYIMELWRRKLA